jgi:hypothetical protein
MVLTGCQAYTTRPFTALTGVVFELLRIVTVWKGSMQVGKEAITFVLHWWDFDDATFGIHMQVDTKSVLGVRYSRPSMSAWVCKGVG